MTPPPSTRPGPPPATRVRRRVRLAVVATFVLATFGGFGLGFSVMTDCTNEYGCTLTGCAPCATANGWLLAGWAGQAVLLLVAGALGVLAARRVRPRAVMIAARFVPTLGLALLVAALVLARLSY